MKSICLLLISSFFLYFGRREFTDICYGAEGICDHFGDGYQAIQYFRWAVIFLCFLLLFRIQWTNFKHSDKTAKVRKA